VLERASSNVADTLRQVVSELRTGHPDRVFHLEIDTEEELSADHVRLGQVFSNLIGNAVMHGDPDQAIGITLRLDDGNLIFRTTNMGDTIPPDAMKRLFQPFSRGEVRSSLQGLGLGLYISSQIAAAHGGNLGASSADRETVFTFQMPVN
jgi:signal transduction histidine kinase